MGDAVWLRQGASHSPERHTTLLGEEISPSRVRASEAVQGREGESPPFFVPIQGQPIVGYTRPADSLWKGNCLQSKSVNVLQGGYVMVSITMIGNMELSPFLVITLGLKGILATKPALLSLKPFSNS